MVMCKKHNLLASLMGILYPQNIDKFFVMSLEGTLLSKFFLHQGWGVLKREMIIMHFVLFFLHTISIGYHEQK